METDQSGWCLAAVGNSNRADDCEEKLTWSWSSSLWSSSENWKTKWVCSELHAAQTALQSELRVITPTFPHRGRGGVLIMPKDTSEAETERLLPLLSRSCTTSEERGPFGGSEFRLEGFTRWKHLKAGRVLTSETPQLWEPVCSTTSCQQVAVCDAAEGGPEVWTSTASKLNVSVRDYKYQVSLMVVCVFRLKPNNRRLL